MHEDKEEIVCEDKKQISRQLSGILWYPLVFQATKSQFLLTSCQKSQVMS